MFASDNCILKSCYRELVLNCTKFTSWATYVRNLLCSLGLSYLWKNRWLLNTDCSILSIICHRLLYQTKQELNSLLEASSKCIVYKCIVSNIDLQFYLQKNIPAMFQKCITKIRLSSHNLFIETGRYTGIVRNERKCTIFNLNVLENEFHFVLQCTKYNDLHKKYIKKYYLSRSSTFKLVQLLSVENRKELCNLGNFIHLECKAKNNLV
jgi:hypothetical protein